VHYIYAVATAKLFEFLLLINANAHHTDHQETLVLNFGLHKDTIDYHEIHHALERWQAYHPPTRRKLQLVWRDTSAQHFPEKGGLFNRTVTLPCMPIDDMRAAFTPYKDITRMLSEFPDVHRLPIWSVTAPRFDAHNPRECTHWCLPGVPDVWVRLLYALLKAQTTASPGQAESQTVRLPCMPSQRGGDARNLTHFNTKVSNRHKVLRLQVVLSNLVVFQLKRDRLQPALAVSQHASCDNPARRRHHVQIRCRRVGMAPRSTICRNTTLARSYREGEADLFR
jgi:hypothetical protein